jgi:pimeloyl-ACP methyl ester carboxylesterase
MSYFFKKKYHKWLVHAGYHVVGFNFKGFGSSTIEGFLFYDDVSSVAIWAKHEFPSVPIHLFGASFGAFQAIHAIARKKLEISSCVFDSVPASIGVFFGSGLMGIIMRQLSNGRYAQITGTNDIFSSIPLPNNIPCLYLYGDQDIHISSSEIEKVRATCGGKNVVMFANCGHLDIKKHYASEYANIVTKFFDAHSDAMASSIINHNT